MMYAVSEAVVLMLLAQPQQRLEPLVLALTAARRSRTSSCMARILLLQLRVFRLQRLIAEDIVVVPLGLPVDGQQRRRGSERESSRRRFLRQLAPLVMASVTATHDGEARAATIRMVLSRRRPEILFQSITSPRRMPALLQSGCPRMRTPASRSIHAQRADRKPHHGEIVAVQVR